MKKDKKMLFDLAKEKIRLNLEEQLNYTLR